MRQAYAFDHFLLFVAERRLEKDGRAMPLGSRAFDLLVALAENAGQVVGKEDLLARAWPDLTVDEGSLRYHISGLRKVLGCGEGNARYIANVPGRGYCLVAPTKVIAPQRARSKPSPERSAGLLPRRLDRMVGRDEDIRKIADQLVPHRFVTIHGPGGIGKTTVAVAVANQMLEAFEGSVYFLDLALLEDSTFVASAVASTLGIILQSNDPTAEIVDFLRERRALIVFDSCEHVIGTLAPLAERIYLDAPGASILATSRERLRVEGEHVILLPTLDHPPEETAMTASQLLSFSATRLLAERAAAHGYDAELSDADAGIMAEICRKLDGMALAIELVASRVATHGLQETAALVDGRFRLLWQGRRTAPPRHQTLAAMIDWSYELIYEAEQVVFRRLAIFVGPFVHASAAAVVSDRMLGPDRVVEAIEGLAAKSLITIARSGDFTEYRLLDTTREYAFTKLVEAGELEQMAKSHAVHMLTTLEQANASPLTEPVELLKQTKQFLAREANSALRWAFSDQGDRTVANRLAAGMGNVFIEFSLLSECRRWTEKALQVLDDGSRSSKVEMELDAALGHALTFTEGNSDKAMSALIRALDVARRLDDHRSQFRLLSRLHMLYRRMARYDQLEPLSKQAEALADRIGEPAGKAAAHNLLGVAFHLAGNQKAARHHLETALSMAEFRRIKPGHFAFHRNPNIALSRCLWLQGYPDQAIAAARPLGTEGAAPDAVTYCIGLIWSASVFEWVGDWDGVEDLAERLRFHALRHSLRPYQAVGQGMAGQSLIRTGDLDKGVAMLRSAIGVLRQDRYEIYIPQLAATLAKALSDCGLADEACQVIDDTLKGVFANGGALEAPELLRVRGEVQHAQGNDLIARASFLDSISLADSQGAPAWRLRAETGLARTHRNQEGAKNARMRLEHLYAQFTEGFHTADMVTAAELLAEMTEAGEAKAS
ncbi:ATPase [Rhizobium sp. KAs_5_22]|uniref:ATP-binding protein n=1 Tax=Ciceribacter selenitireducens TaxID=448181 RepID=UPI0004B8F3CC|nr:winged helix-turn-helix domain-containing protein [Ciceribacter selenitireducens]PPJ48975.1 ATPase [Rhizobium sp. KAs_5_22]